MATKLYPYRAECEKAGVAIYFLARNEKEAIEKLVSHPGYWQAQKKFKTNRNDWIITEGK